MQHFSTYRHQTFLRLPLKLRSSIPERLTLHTLRCMPARRLFYLPKYRYREIFENPKKIYLDWRIAINRFLLKIDEPRLHPYPFLKLNDCNAIRKTRCERFIQGLVHHGERIECAFTAGGPPFDISTRAMRTESSRVEVEATADFTSRQ